MYFKTITEGSEVKIDMSSVCWYAEPEDKTGYTSVAWWGTAKDDQTNPDKNPMLALEYISAGLNSTVKNRYLMPIATSTIADAQGKIANSYGF